MRIDEYGRWVSDDGAYVWDEAGQTWLSAAAPPVQAPAPPAQAPAPPATTAYTAATPPAAASEASTSAYPGNAYTGSTYTGSTYTDGEYTGAGYPDPAAPAPAAPAPAATFGAWQTRSGEPAGQAGPPAAAGAPLPPRGGGGYQPGPAPFYTPGHQQPQKRGSRAPLFALIAVVGVLALAVGLFFVLAGGGKAKKAPVALATSSSPSTTPSTTQSATPTTAHYDPRIESAFTTECLRTSSGKTTYCACALSTFEKGYTQAQFLALNNNINAPASRAVVQKIATQCLGKS